MQTVQTIELKVFGQTDVGRSRDHNEDGFLTIHDLKAPNSGGNKSNFLLSDKGCLLVVADGMGGAEAGEVASDIALKSIGDEFSNLDVTSFINDKSILAFLKQAVFQSHSNILNYARKHPECMGMGTTINVTYILNGKAYIAWCGDSRAYGYSQQEREASTSYDSPNLKILTQDHSMVWEMVEQGSINAEQARIHDNSNIITQSLGSPHSPPEPEAKVVKLYKGDRILVCSDGLNGMLPDIQIEQILREEEDLEEAVQFLINAANAAGGQDNVTVVLADITNGPDYTGIIDEESEEIENKKDVEEETPELVTQAMKAPSLSDELQEKSNFLMPIILAMVLIALGAWYFLRNTDSSINQPKSETSKTTLLQERKDYAISKTNSLIHNMNERGVNSILIREMAVDIKNKLNHEDDESFTNDSSEIFLAIEELERKIDKHIPEKEKKKKVDVEVKKKVINVPKSQEPVADVRLQGYPELFKNLNKDINELLSKTKTFIVNDKSLNAELRTIKELGTETVKLIQEIYDARTHKLKWKDFGKTDKRFGIIATEVEIMRRRLSAFEQKINSFKKQKIVEAERIKAQTENDLKPKKEKDPTLSDTLLQVKIEGKSTKKIDTTTTLEPQYLPEADSVKAPKIEQDTIGDY